MSRAPHQRPAEVEAAIESLKGAIVFAEMMDTHNEVRSHAQHLLDYIATLERPPAAGMDELVRQLAEVVFGIPSGSTTKPFFEFTREATALITSFMAGGGWQDIGTAPASPVRFDVYARYYSNCERKWLYARIPNCVMHCDDKNHVCRPEEYREWEVTHWHSIPAFPTPSEVGKSPAHEGGVE